MEVFLQSDSTLKQVARLPTLSAVVMHNPQLAQLGHHLHDGSHTDWGSPKV
ncbi:hypothetical protein O987_22670 [Comamonas testosteroni TK102]|uniref:Uncharacterized protein n=1 Tax=Comamonas testosteroni TK102 TaxID=1392005 RepID=A0A076PV79_COMTE|nr:hypothetical protein O987_22670 [Comamonas testosteroni TK102]